MRKLKIVLGCYPDLFYRVGGLQIQVSNTYHELKQLGHDVYYTHEWVKRKPAVDIYHQFSYDISLLKLFDANKKISEKTVVSPIFQKNGSVKQSLIKVINRIPKLDFVLYNSIKERVASTDGFIFLGNDEKKKFEQFYDQKVNIFKLIPNGINIIPHHAENKDGYIISVGSICRRKNQLSLIKIATRLGIPLKLVGPINDYDYYRKCQLEAQNGEIEFCGPIENSSRRFTDLLSKASIFVLASHSEVLPISVFEAVICGTPVICTENSSVKDYINGPFIKFVNSHNMTEIENSILSILKTRIVPTSDDIYNIKKKYEWSSVAAELSNFYNQVLE